MDAIAARRHPSFENEPLGLHHSEILGKKYSKSEQTRAFALNAIDGTFAIIAFGEGLSALTRKLGAAPKKLLDRGHNLHFTFGRQRTIPRPAHPQKSPCDRTQVPVWN